jgi:two-component system invasion response regulator UvrY
MSREGCKQILIADDSSIVRNILKELLEDHGNLEVCAEASDGAEALAKARELRPDLVLLDLAMPGMGGAETAAALKKILPDVPIIVFTMYSENIGKALTSASGVEFVLSKPEGLKPLMRAVDTLLNKTPHSKAFQAGS